MREYHKQSYFNIVLSFLFLNLKGNSSITSDNVEDKIVLQTRAFKVDKFLSILKTLTSKFNHQLILKVQFKIKCSLSNPEAKPCFIISNSGIAQIVFGSEPLDKKCNSLRILSPLNN